MGKKLRVFGCINLVVFVALCSTYFTFIHHPPPEEILKNQQVDVDSNTFELDPQKTHTMAEISKAAWGKWVYQNKYVPVGSVYDGPCGDESNILIGKLVVMLDPDTGGVKLHLYTNTTFDTPIYYGKIYVKTLYNDNELSNNALDLCEAGENDPDKVLKCPIAKGMHFFKKEWKISPFLPKGEYKVKVWITNQRKEVQLCVLLTLKL